MSYFSGRDILWTVWWYDTWIGSIELNDNRTRCNVRNMRKNSLNWLKGVRWLTKVDRLRDKLKTQLFIYANVDRCHVERWTVEYFHKTKRWKTLFGNEPLISQVCEKYENGLVIWWAITSVCYPLWTRKKEKTHSPFEVGKLKERGMVFIFLW